MEAETRQCESDSTGGEHRAHSQQDGSGSSESGSISNSEEDYASMDEDGMVENGEIRAESHRNSDGSQAATEVEKSGDTKSKSSHDGSKHVPISWPHDDEKLPPGQENAGKNGISDASEPPQIYGTGPTKHSGQGGRALYARPRYSPYNCTPNQAYGRGPRDAYQAGGPRGPRLPARRGPSPGAPARDLHYGTPGRHTPMRPGAPSSHGPPGPYHRGFPGRGPGRLVMPHSAPHPPPYNLPYGARIVPAGARPRLRVRPVPVGARVPGGEVWATESVPGSGGPVRYRANGPRSCGSLEGIGSSRPPGLRPADWVEDANMPRSVRVPREVVHVYTDGSEYGTPRGRPLVRRVQEGAYEEVATPREVYTRKVSPSSMRFEEERSLDGRIERIIDERERPVRIVRVEPAPLKEVRPRIERYEAIDAAVAPARTLQRAASFISVPSSAATYRQPAEVAVDPYAKVRPEYEPRIAERERSPYGRLREEYQLREVAPASYHVPASLSDRERRECVSAEPRILRTESVRPYSRDLPSHHSSASLYGRPADACPTPLAHRVKSGSGQPSPILSHNENVSEWMYRDPQGQVRGPYSIRQFRQWVGNLENKDELRAHYERFLSVELWKEGSDAKCTIGLETILKLNQPPEI